MKGYTLCYYIRALVQEGSSHPRNGMSMGMSASVLVHIAMKCILQVRGKVLFYDCCHMVAAIIKGLIFHYYVIIISGHIQG